MSNLLDIEGLRVHFDTLDGPVEALHSVSLSVKEGEIMGVVGESGCGKSVTSLVTIGLASCDVDEGSITFDGKDLIHEVTDSTAKILSSLRLISSISGFFLILSMLWFFSNPISGFYAAVATLLVLVSCLILIFFIETPSRNHEQFLRSVRGNKISMIFQEPMTALNPLYSVEKQVAEVLRQHGKLDAAESPLGLRIAQALVYPGILLSNFARNDTRAALQVLGTFISILLIHQSGYSDLALEILTIPVMFLIGFVSVAIELLIIPADALLTILSNLLAFLPVSTEFLTFGTAYTILLGCGVLVELFAIKIIGFRVWAYFHLPKELNFLLDKLEFVLKNTAQLIVGFVVLFILLWIPFGVLMTIIMTIAILAIPPIQITGFLRLDPVHSRQVVNILREVKIPNPEAVIKMYPHELSGGMRQRVMIAMMMACEPKLLIADEPTTALDVTIQAQILGLMKDLRDREGTAIMMITHDLGVIAETCDAVSVMYAGSVVETGSLEQVLGSPRMPYTIGLLHSIPRIKEEGEARTDLPIIPGQVPDPSTEFDGCRFHPRCPFADDTCRSTPPPMEEVSPGHFSSCHHTELTIDLDSAQQAFSATQFLNSEVSAK